MRALKALVIVLGVLIVGGTLALIAALVWRGTHGTAVRAPSAPLAAPFAASLDLPSDATILSTETAGERFLVRAQFSDGRDEVFVLDLKSGARLGTIELRAAR
ncbi:MAG TPA: DUF6476 family protein [Stellaceae bacterium]|nr:DUF6476 family protein [Stellaceae bacterium]